MFDLPIVQFHQLQSVMTPRAVKRAADEEGTPIRHRGIKFGAQIDFERWS
ncbi:MAG: hypothetical protein ABJA98_23185 [Acidobacteriota bacterium]